MVIEQTVEIPVDYQVFHELPRSIPSIEEVRRLLQKEMAEKGTSNITVASGDGWEAHVMEHYAEP
jgi:hypothetical protein